MSKKFIGGDFFYRLDAAFPLEDGLEDPSLAFAEAESLGEAVVVDVASLLLLLVMVLIVNGRRLTKTKPNQKANVK